jgi:murein L,D-transpeptidase YcbB/YkuD
MEAGRDAATARLLTSFYEARGFRPAWTAAGRPTANGEAVLKTLAGAAADGLEPADYVLDGSGSDAGVEVGISRALLHYGCDLKNGRLEPTAEDAGLFVIRRPSLACSPLDGAAVAPDIAAYLATLAPKSAEYARLKATLARAREIAAAGGWIAVPPGTPLKLGMTDPRVADLRRALAERGDGTGETAGEPDVFDFDLETALRRFQRRHGLAADGVFGRASQLALAVPATERIRQIVRNLERRRWMPDKLGRRHVLVNPPTSPSSWSTARGRRWIRA